MGAEQLQKVQRYRRGQEFIHRRQAGDRVREQIAADQGGPGVKQTISRESAEKRHKNN